MDKDLQYIENAIEASPEEYHEYLEATGQWMTEHQYYEFEQCVSDAEFESYRDIRGS